MKVEIKNKETIIEIDKDHIVEVLETADGVAFNLRNNLSLIYVNNFMTSTAKQLIKGTIDQCKTVNATIMVDLENPNQPVTIMVNEVAPASK
jgi:hypothetical protein